MNNLEETIELQNAVIEREHAVHENELADLRQQLEIVTGERDELKAAFTEKDRILSEILNSKTYQMAQKLRRLMGKK